jgi:glutathionylspermidine synthase
MCLELVDRVVADDVLLTMFEIPNELWPAVRKSWREKKPDLLGRFDLAWDGNGPPKLLEYNGDTPSVLVESALSQKNWQKDKHS